MIITDISKLREVCTPVLDEEIEEIKSKLEQELHRSARRGKPGIGLAAPQIGINKRMAIVRIKSSSGTEYNIDLINPQILEQHDPISFEEGCLSMPGETITTTRFNEINVKTAGKPHHLKATGLIAVCIQHEIDHLDGILMFDRAVTKEDQIKDNL